MAKFDFSTYMKNVAVSLKEIAHVDGDSKNKRFYRVSSLQALEELITTLRSMGSINLAIEDNLDGGLSESKGQFVEDKQLYSFLVLQKSEALDMDARKLVIDTCEVVVKKILSKLRHNHLTDCELETNYGLSDFDVDSVNYFSFGPVLNSCYGVHCTFTVGNNASIKYNAEDWNE